MTMLTSDHIYINQSWLLHVLRVDVSIRSQSRQIMLSHTYIYKNSLKVFSHHEIKRIRSFEKKLTFSSPMYISRSESLFRQNKHIAAVHSCVNHFNIFDRLLSYQSFNTICPSLVRNWPFFSSSLNHSKWYRRNIFYIEQINEIEWSPLNKQLIWNRIGLFRLHLHIFTLISGFLFILFIINQLIHQSSVFTTK